MALQVQSLNARVLEQLAEVQASRARIVESVDVARRRVERDLHDGAQQRLVALGMLLQQGKRDASRKGDRDLADLFDRATAELVAGFLFPGLGENALLLIAVPAALAEVSFLLWLLVKGAKTNPVSAELAPAIV